MLTKKDQLIKELEGIERLVKEVDLPASDKIKELGFAYVISFKDELVTCSSFPDAQYGELVIFGLKDEFAENIIGMINGISEFSVQITLFNKKANIREGTKVFRLKRIISPPDPFLLLGRVIDPLYRSLDGRGKIISSKSKTSETEVIGAEIPGIDKRNLVSRPLFTGWFAIDTLVPIGRGQRELIIGDRQTGKTTLVLETILNQTDKKFISIYISIGQKTSSSLDIIHALGLDKEGVKDKIVVIANADQSSLMQYLAPYAGVSIGEKFLHLGYDVLIVLDDLSKHANAYRTISLLLRRPPGREAYPGDIFFLHSRLLERGCQLNQRNKGGSITILPLIETQAGDVASYISTNVISITDGQIYLDVDLFNSGVLPAIDLGISVSRIGGAAQPKIISSLTSFLKLKLLQYREYKIFSQFSSSLDKSVIKSIKEGENVSLLLNQEKKEKLNIYQQSLLLVWIWSKSLFLFPSSLVIKIKERITKLRIPKEKLVWLLMIKTKEGVQKAIGILRQELMIIINQELKNSPLNLDLQQKIIETINPRSNEKEDRD